MKRTLKGINILLFLVILFVGLLIWNRPIVYVNENLVYIEDETVYFNIELDRPRKVIIEYKEQEIRIPGKVNLIRDITRSKLGYGTYKLIVDNFYVYTINVVR